MSRKNSREAKAARREAKAAKRTAQEARAEEPGQHPLESLSGALGKTAGRMQASQQDFKRAADLIDQYAPEGAGEMREWLPDVPEPDRSELVDLMARCGASGGPDPAQADGAITTSPPWWQGTPESWAAYVHSPRKTATAADDGPASAEG